MKLSFNKIQLFGINKQRIEKIPWTLASHAFSIMLFLILLSLCLGVLLFYKYVILIENQSTDMNVKNITFNEKTYEEILQQWELKEHNLQKPSDTIRINPFTNF